MGLENYHVKDQIGKGTYGKVFRGIRKTTCQFVAMKFIEDVKSKTEDWAKEVKILNTIKHANVLQMIDYFDTPQGFCIVTELAQGDLSSVLNNGEGLSEEEVQKIAKQLVGALSCLHSKRIVHRDMKPQNTLIFPGGVVKICDFGVARVMSPDTIALRSMIGTLHYMAPELIRGESYNHTADLWSLGLILYQLYHGHLPFNSKSVYGHLLMWQKGTDLIKYSPKMSSNFKSFVRGLLNTDPTKRLQGSNLLMHPFVSRPCKDVDAKEFRANAAGSRVPDVAWKKKSRILTNGLISAKPEGCQLLDWLENKSRSVEDAKLIAQDDEAVLVVLKPLKDQFHRNKDVLTLNQSLNIISKIVDAGDVNTTRVIYEMLWAIIGFTTNLIDMKESDYNDLLVKCFRVVKKLLVKYENWFGSVHTSHWIAIVGLFKEVAGCTEAVASGRVLYESVSCITAIVFVSRVSQDDRKEMLYYAKETSLEDTLLSCLVTCGTSLMSGSKDFLAAACEVCRAIWSLLTASESQYTKDNVFIFPLSSMYDHISDRSSNQFDKSSNGAYCRKIADAVTKAFLFSKAIQVAFNLCVIGLPSMGTCFPALQIILRCCVHDNSVNDVLCGFPSSLPVTRVVSGGGDATIISTIFSILYRYASPERVSDGKLANPDALIRDLCLVLATVAQSLKSVGRNSVVFLLTSSPEKQLSRLSDLAHHCSRMQNYRSSAMLALASIFSLEGNGASSISKIALPLIPGSTMLCDYLSTAIDGIESKLSIWHGFRDGCVGLIEARLNWDEASTIQQLRASGLPRTLVDLLGGKNHSSQNQIGLSPSGVVWALSLLCHCLAGRRSTLREPWITKKNVKVLSTLISDVHLKLISDWDGPGGGKIGVRDTVNAVINLLEIAYDTLKNGTHTDIDGNIENYIEILKEVGIPGQIVRCMEDVELEDAVRPVAFLARMTLHQSLIVQLLDKGLLDPGKVRRLLGTSSPRTVTLDILRILSTLAKMDKDFYKHIEKADILPFLRKFLTHEDPNVREEACSAIGKMCLHSGYFYHILAKHKVISLLVDCYSDQDKDVRYRASFAICGAAYHNDLLYEELGGCIPQLTKFLLLEEGGYKSKRNACYMLGNLVRNSDKFCQEIIYKGAMKALLELVANCSLNPCDPREKESLLDISLQALGKLCRHLPCRQFFHSSVHYPVIERFCQASELMVAASVSHIFNKTVTKQKGRLARGT